MDSCEKHLLELYQEYEKNPNLCKTFTEWINNMAKSFEWVVNVSQSISKVKPTKRARQLKVGEGRRTK